MEEELIDVIIVEMYGRKVCNEESVNIQVRELDINLKMINAGQKIFQLIFLIFN